MAGGEEPLDHAQLPRPCDHGRSIAAGAVRSPRATYAPGTCQVPRCATARRRGGRARRPPRQRLGQDRTGLMRSVSMSPNPAKAAASATPTPPPRASGVQSLGLGSGIAVVAGTIGTPGFGKSVTSGTNRSTVVAAVGKSVANRTNGCGSPAAVGDMMRRAAATRALSASARRGSGAAEIDACMGVLLFSGGTLLGRFSRSGGRVPSRRRVHRKRRLGVRPRGRRRRTRLPSGGSTSRPLGRRSIARGRPAAPPRSAQRWSDAGAPTLRRPRPSSSWGRTARPGTRSCPPRYERKGPGEIPKTHSLLRALASVCEVTCELRARAHAQLCVGVLEVHLHRSHADEEGLRDLLVRQAVGCKLHDALLGGRQVAARLRPPAADALLLGPRLLSPAGGTELVEFGRRLLQRRSGRGPFPQPAPGASEREERPCPVERQTELAVRVGCLRQPGCRVLLSIRV